MAVMALTLASCGTDTYGGRWLHWRASDIGDVHRFPSRPLERSERPFLFTPARHPGALVIEVPGNGGGEELATLAERTGSTALLVIRRDTLIFEGYFNGYTRDSVNTSFSVAKSITSLLVGIAAAEGTLAVDDPATAYLPELAERDRRFDDITLRHLLDMESGIAFRDHDLPWGDKPKAYYRPDLRRAVVQDIRVAEPPGGRWVYNTYNPIVLGMVLERATGATVTEFTHSRLWSPLRMEYDGSWSVDGTVDPMEKMESGVNGRAVDFAKIGRLVLRRGDWDGRRVIPESWIEASIVPEPGCEIDGFRPRRICYQRGWWLHPGGDDQRYAVGAWGHLGQYVYIFPEQELVLVRFGRKTGGVYWPDAFQAIAAAVAAPR